MSPSVVNYNEFSWPRSTVPKPAATPRDNGPEPLQYKKRFGKCGVFHSVIAHHSSGNIRFTDAHTHTYPIFNLSLLGAVVCKGDLPIERPTKPNSSAGSVYAIFALASCFKGWVECLQAWYHGSCPRESSQDATPGDSYPSQTKAQKRPKCSNCIELNSFFKIFPPSDPWAFRCLLGAFWVPCHCRLV